MNFTGQLKEKQDIVNDYLKEMLQIKGAPDRIVEAMKYSLMAGGKRIRPILAMAVCNGLGGNERDALPLGCSIELIHTYSLIHDDLPAMDNDDLRRGRPTSHVMFDEATAILAGDALLNYSFEHILKVVIDNNYASNYIRASHMIAKASGALGMIGGQVIDIQSEGKHISMDELLYMHSKKTGAIIEASCLVGGIIANKEDILGTVMEYSSNLGVAFQIVDDILDCTGDTEKLGKKVGRDEKKDKTTFVKLVGLEESKKLAFEYTRKALQLSNKLDNTGFLEQLTNYLLNRES